MIQGQQVSSNEEGNELGHHQPVNVQVSVYHVFVESLWAMFCFEMSSRTAQVFRSHLRQFPAYPTLDLSFLVAFRTNLHRLGYLALTTIPFGSVSLLP